MTDDDLTGDTWAEEVDDDEPLVPKMVANSAIARSLYRDPALAEAIGREQLGLTQMVTRYQNLSDDPVYEILEMTRNITTVVGQVYTNIPVLVSDAMTESAANIESRVILAVRQSSRPIDLEPLTAQLIAVSEVAAKNTSTQLEAQTVALKSIALKPQKIPYIFYASVGVVGLASLLASAFTWKTVQENMKIVEWASTPDGQLAKAIVTANKGRLDRSCKDTTRKLDKKVKINGIDRDKICFVAIP
jgi:hypothetical protein